ncbi:MAG: hypothetical protein HZT43_14280 [Exiguobacterium profundum]|nr:MAG: hypothetical protein HZT43_14280 [Exiguobacterium profundum]
MTEAVSQWKEFLDPETLRRRMLSAAMFLVAHEMLVVAIKQRLHDFFLMGFDQYGLRYSSEYEERVLTLDPKGKRDPWRASIVWLESMSAIDQTDKEKIKKCTDARNLFAHELGEIISSRKKPDFEGLFPILVELVIKVDKWWIVNVEAETDPDLADEKIDVDQVVPGSQIMLSIIHQAALGDIEAAKELYEAFVSGMAEAS